MNIRTIKIASTALGLKTIESNAETFGELLPELRRLNIDPSKNTIIFEGNRAEITREDTLLPEGNFNLFSYPKEVKSGVDFDEMEDNIESIESILEEMNETLSDTYSKVEDIDNSTDTIKEEIDIINNKLDELLLLFKNHNVKDSDFKVEVEETTLSLEDQRLLEEAQKLAENL